MAASAGRRGLSRAVASVASAAAVSALVVVALGGCSDEPASSPQSPGGVDNPTISVAPSTQPSNAVPSREPVVVRSHVTVPRTPAVRSLLTFVRAHAEAVRRGRETPLLSRVTTPAQLAAQRRVIGFAVAQGYVVPSEPAVRVVAVADRSARSVALATCFWLPSTEYVDETTGAPPSGPVPRSWAAAIAVVRLVGVTWSVDTLREPGRGTSIRCGGRP